MKQKMLLLLLILFLFSCRDSKITSGTIEKLYYVPPHYENKPEVFVAGDIVVGTSRKVWIPDTTFYVLMCKFVNGKKKNRDIAVSSMDFYKYSVGDSVVVIKD
jgi:hypothetical protein